MSRRDAPRVGFTVGAAVLLIRPGRGLASASGLQLVAAALTSVLTFAVAVFARALWLVPSSEVMYRVLSVAIVGVLLVPLVTLGTASARLAARSRDDRLATLRLLGASAARVRGIAVAEVAVTAVFGVALGTAIAAALPFALSVLPLHGAPLTAADLWLPWWAVVAIPPVLVGIAAGSALLGLRRVVLSPLGVRTRDVAPRMGWSRVFVAVAVAGAAVLVVQLASPGWGLVIIVGALMLVMIAVMAILGVVGPFAVSRIAALRARRTSDPAALVAARGVQDDPKGAWRSVSTLALASFIVIPAGSLLGYLDTIQRSESREIITPDQFLILADARTIVLALTGLAFLVVTCQVALTQTAAVFERRELHLALDRLGMPLSAQNRVRRLRVMMPANVAVIGASISAVAIAFPLVGVALFVAPLFVLAIVLILALGLLLLRAGVALTSPVLRRVLMAPARGE